MKNKLCFLYLTLVFTFLYWGGLSGCKEKQKRIGEKDIVADTAALVPEVAQVLEVSLSDILQNNGHLDSLHIFNAPLIRELYARHDYKPLWSESGRWKASGDSLYQFFKTAYQWGLFPDDYHYDVLTSLRQQTALASSNESRLNASLWAEQDLLLTAGFIRSQYDLKLGRLLSDSLLLADTSFTTAFFEAALDSLATTDLSAWTGRLEPQQPRYVVLKQALAAFLPGADLRKFTYINPKDTLALPALIRKRLKEQDPVAYPDTLSLEEAIRKYQKSRDLKVDGTISSRLITALNRTDRLQFLKIAVTLDRLKGLAKLPDQYVWVNIPSYQLQVWEGDSVVLTSKVVVGKTTTRTPILTSALTDMITYPQWHIPNSIIKKDILPALKRDPGYLARKGFSLSDGKGTVIDPYSIRWSQYTDGIPYQVIQGSGDDNALGVLKFNFPNKYSVYLHDTNQRSFFSRQERALSHGCVRVQAWNQLAAYLLARDSSAAKAVPIDSLHQWLAVKEKHVIPLQKRMPLYIRYFTAEVVDGQLKLYDDVYGEDRRLIEKYFATK